MAFLGMVSTDDWEDNIRPEDWTAHLFREYPNGGMFNEGAIPLTGFSALMANSKVTKDKKFHWWNKTLAAQSTSITAGEIYTDVGMGSAVSATDTAAGTVLYLKVPLAFAQECVPGYKIVLFDESDDRAWMSALILDVELNGASSKLTIRTLKADTGQASYCMKTCDYVWIAGSAFAEGSSMPESMHYDPTEYWNVTTIQKNVIEQTRTAKNTEQRTEDDWQEDIREQGELHAIGLEWDAIFGVRSSNTGGTAKELRTSQGVLDFIDTYSPSANRDDYRRNSNYTGMTWEQGGADWLASFLVEFAVWGPSEVFALCGNLVMKSVYDLAMFLGWTQIAPHSVDFGIEVTTWETPFGVLHFKPHPLFMRQPGLKRACLIGHPKNMIKRYIEGANTVFKEKLNTPDIDADKAGWLSEIGWQFTMPKQWAFLNGFGADA